jgi:hypothetical protein
MSKKNRPTRHRASRKKRGSQASSILIPALVGVVVLAIVIGIIITLEGRQPAAGSSAAVPTVQAGAAGDVPFASVPRAPVEDTFQRLNQGEVLVVDVRSKTSYDAGHIAGAISVPEEELDARLDELPRDAELVLYCT